MTKETIAGAADVDPGTVKPRALRADARRSEEALLEAALAVFTASGVDAPVRDIAERAGVGIGTLYRRFPQRADLIVAVFCRQVDACADAAPLLARDHGPGEAVSRWMLRYADFLMAKRGLASALHSGDPAYSALPAYFDLRLQPALRSLLDAAAAAGEVRADIEPNELLRAVGNLCCTPASGDGAAAARRMVTLLVDGLRYGARSAGAGERAVASI
ncbi:MAG TPA: helix-turn-helix domain-containing protein [Telluria sp.]|jgi:AcrR family transcriptional regulator